MHTKDKNTGSKRILPSDNSLEVSVEPVVKPWLERGDDFVLEEDGDSGHGTGRTRNAVKKWKEDHHLEHYFNCPSSPDLAPLKIAGS